MYHLLNLIQKALVWLEFEPKFWCWDQSVPPRHHITIQSYHLHQTPPLHHTTHRHNAPPRLRHSHLTPLFYHHTSLRHDSLVTVVTWGRWWSGDSGDGDGTGDSGNSDDSCHSGLVTVKKAVSLMRQNRRDSTGDSVQARVGDTESGSGTVISDDRSDSGNTDGWLWWREMLKKVRVPPSQRVHFMWFFQIIRKRKCHA